MDDFAQARGTKLTQEAAAELHRIDPNLELPVILDIHTACCLIGNLQLALRHPANTGPSREVTRQFIDGIIREIERHGYLKVAELLRLGDNQAYDYQPPRVISG